MDSNGEETRPRNLIDELRAALGGAGLGEQVNIVGLRGTGEFDLAVVTRSPEERREAAAALASHPDVESVKRAGQRLLVRFDDALVWEIGERLEDERAYALASHDLLAGERYVVEFCNPNATKALHTGHMRNIAIGQGFACALEAAGAEIERQCQITDAGQQSGEAMAGYQLYAEGGTPESEGVKGDRFVGDLYARYVAEHSSVHTEDVAEQDLAVARELTKRDELAATLLDRWLAEDEEVLALWRTILEWVLTGQSETLARLGVRFERQLFESAYYPQLAELVRRGLERGLFAHDDNGRMVYPTGREEYPEFPLARPDGFSTLNLRSLTLWHELTTELEGVTVVHVCGMEWLEHTICIREILEQLLPGAALQPTHDVVHGMVSTELGIASSSLGNVVLVDDLLDHVARSEEVTELALPGRPGCEADDLAVMVTLGFFLDRPVLKRLHATNAAILDPRKSTGMVLARAWVKACAAAGDGPPQPRPDDPVYRFAAMQAQVYRQMLRLGLEELDVLPLVRFLARFSEWYLEQPDEASTARVMRTVLGQGLRSLGLLRAEAAVAASTAG